MVVASEGGLQWIFFLFNFSEIYGSWGTKVKVVKAEKEMKKKTLLEGYLRNKKKA